jgi:hypothetical protein
MFEVLKLDGDSCTEADDCPQNLRVRHHERDPQLGTDPAAPEREAVCAWHGVVAKS